MSREGVLMTARRAKSSRMTSRCTVERTTGETTDATTGIATQTVTPVWSGPCYLPRQNGGLGSRGSRLADVAAMTEQGTVIEVPWDTAGLAVDDVLTVTASPMPANVGRQLRIIGLPIDEEATVLRVACEELT